MLLVDKKKNKIKTKNLRKDNEDEEQKEDEGERKTMLKMMQNEKFCCWLCDVWHGWMNGIGNGYQGSVAKLAKPQMRHKIFN